MGDKMLNKRYIAKVYMDRGRNQSKSLTKGVSELDEERSFSP